MNPKLGPTGSAIEAVSDEAWNPMPYFNRKGVCGTRVQFHAQGQFHKISVSDWEGWLGRPQLTALLEEAAVIDSRHAGTYFNGRGQPGFNVSVAAQFHWIMISRRPDFEIDADC